MTGYGENRFGDGQYGGIIGANPINLHVKSKTSSVVTLAWSAQAVDGYFLFKNGKQVSSSWDGAKTTWTAAYSPGDVFEVRPVRNEPSSTIKL